MIKVKVNNEYKDVVKIFCGGTLQKEITKVWSREAQGYVYESSVEYTGTLPITITANGDALLDYRIYGADGGVGEHTANLIDASLSEQTIEIKPSTGYVLCKYVNIYARYLTYGIYDENDNQIWGDYLGSFTSQSIPVTDNAKYFKISIPDQFLNAVSLVEGRNVRISAHVPETYIPYGYKLPMVVQSESESVNLFDKNTVIPDSVIDNATGEILSNQSYDTTAMMDIESDFVIAYVKSILGFKIFLRIAFYDTQNNFISCSHIEDSVNPCSVSHCNVEVPNGTKKVRVSYTNSKADNTSYPNDLFIGSIAPAEYEVYIGENQLYEGEYVSYGEQKVYRRTAQVTPSAPAETKVQNGITITCDGQGRYSISGTATSDVLIRFDIPEFTIPISVGQGGQGTMSLFNKLSAYDRLYIIKFYYNSDIIDSWSLQSEKRTSTTYITMSGEKCNAIAIEIPDRMSLNGIVSPMFTNDGVLPSIYAPYLQPSAMPVPLPEIQTIDGTTIIDYDGDPKPSQMYIKYRR